MIKEYNGSIISSRIKKRQFRQMSVLAFFEDYEIETQYLIRCCYFRQKIRLVFIQKTMKIDKSAEKL